MPKIDDTAWELFSVTGNPGYYLFFKSLRSEDNEDEDLRK